MFMLTNVAFWPWLLIASILASLTGAGLYFFFPDPWRRGSNYTSHLGFGAIGAIIASSTAGYFVRTPLVVVPVGLLIAYFLSRLPTIEEAPAATQEQPKVAESHPIDRLLFQKDWDARPRYETQEEGLFVGRREVLDRLASDFTSKRSGTILVSGVRGVGKTALVDRALLEARNKLQNRYWKQALPLLTRERFWHPLEVQVRRVLSEFARNAFTGFTKADDHVSLKEAAEKYTASRAPRFWQRFNPVYRRIRRMDEASRSQLFVLKFNASDIGGALADPGQTPTPGKPQVNPDKLLRALIRKLFMTCHSSRPTPEAQILKWSLGKKERQQFFETLENAYNKSVSKAYKETIQKNANDVIKLTQSIVSESKFNLEKILGLLVVCAAVGFGSHWVIEKTTWKPVSNYIATGAAAVAGFATWSVATKRSREATSDRSRQIQASYEFDYSLAQMEFDLQAIVRALHPDINRPFDPRRCFTRTVIVFDELDKLEDSIAQLNDVITHFKNFFTLSEALFVFITDQAFYEHLTEETLKAQQKRQYSPEHTFFTQKIYLRKPEFAHFHETVYRFCDAKALESRAKNADLATDPDLVDYLLPRNPQLLSELTQWCPFDTLTHLYIHRNQYKSDERSVIEEAFKTQDMWSHPLAVGQVWASLVDSPVESDNSQELQTAANAFATANGWEDPEAVAFLFYKRFAFSDADRAAIERAFERLAAQPYLERHTSLKEMPFNLSDLARALCFQTRNHYFDLYYLIYDYVGSYSDGAPVLHMEGERFNQEQKLWSRYQRMVEAAFYHYREDHPSREYFNTLCMESLYSVFDTRARGSSVPVKDILFSVQSSAGQAAGPAAALAVAAVPAATPGAAAAPAVVAVPPATAGVAAPLPVMAAASTSLSEAISLINPREANQINQAIFRLLRLAEARKAAVVSPALGAKLKELDTDSVLDLTVLRDLEFTWTQDCEPEISLEGIDLEQYERDLIKFWDDNKIALEALDAELEKIGVSTEVSTALSRVSAAQKTRTSIAKLRSRAESLRRRSATISRPDASALRADLGTPDAMSARVPSFVLERIQAQGDAEILLAANLKEALENPRWQSVVGPRRQEVEAVSKLPLRAVVIPQESKSLMCFLSGPMPTSADAKSLEQIVAKPDSHLFWYAPRREPSELQSYPQGVHFYFPPSDPEGNKSVSAMFDDYYWLASVGRLEQIAEVARTTEYRGGTGLQAGAELVGAFTTTSEIVLALSDPTTVAAANKLDELPTNLKAKTAPDVWRAYGVDPEKDWSAAAAVKALAVTIAPTATQGPTPSSVQALIEKAITPVLGTDPSKLTAVSLASALVSGEPHRLVDALYQAAIADVIARRWQRTGIQDPAVFSMIEKEFSPWLLRAIEELAKSKKVEIRNIPSYLPSWTADLETQRLSLRSTHFGIGHKAASAPAA